MMSSTKFNFDFLKIAENV